MNPRTPVDSVAPLRPPRRSPVKTEPAAPIERLDPGTVLAPTRFLRELPGQAPSPGGVALCDGRRSVAEVARDAGLAPDLVRELLSQHYAEGLVHETGEGPVPAVLFFEHVRSLCLRWRRARLAARPGIEPLFSAGTSSKRLAVGYLLEVTHIVRGAAGHIAAAIAHASDERLQLLLSEYLEDEYWHGSWMDDALRGGGLGEEDLVRALPLPETLAVLNSWRHAGQTDLLLYGGLIGITESGPGEEGQTEALFRATLGQGVLPEAAWRPYFEHAIGDGAADHLAHGRAIFAAAPPLTRSRRDALRRLLLLHTEALVHQEHAVLDFYAADEGPLVHDLEWRVSRDGPRPEGPSPTEAR
jgi:hypothetical protein